jgi:N-dimethylarginine dimethylaminohydrolase
MPFKRFPWPQSRLDLEELIPPNKRIIATAAEAAAFSVNAVNIGRTLYLSSPPASLIAKLRDYDYDCVGLDLSCFVMSGGGSFCMTLRLDRASKCS